MVPARSAGMAAIAHVPTLGSGWMPGRMPKITSATSLALARQSRYVDADIHSRLPHRNMAGLTRIDVTG